MADDRCDVIVVGGGPAGSACANFCAQQGKRVVLVERTRFPRDKLCGDYLNPKCWEILERLRVAQALRGLPHHASPGFLFSTLGGRRVEVQFAKRIREAHSSIAVSRRLLDQCLLESAAVAGVKVWQQATLIGLRREKDWTAEVETLEGRTLISAPVVVGADGRHSFVGRQAGLLLKKGIDNRVGIQFTIQHAATMSDCIQLHQLPEGYCGVVKIGGGLTNVCMVTPRKSAGQDSFNSLRRNPVLGHFLSDTQPFDKPRSITPILGSRFRVSDEGILLVGDAARVTEPFTGQGIYFALRGAQLAAESIGCGDLRSYASRLGTEYKKQARTNRLLCAVLRRTLAVQGMAWLANLHPRWMEAIVGSVVE